MEEDLCIHCEKCISVCPRYLQKAGFSKQDNEHSLYDVPIYAVQSCEEETVFRCSSGGFVHEASVWALAHGYKAAGVAYNYVKNKTEHRLVTDARDLTELDGSKYILSDTRIFKRIIREAKKSKENRYFIIGTPCQCLSLIKAAENENVRDQMIFIDIFCHGVPSYKLWIEEIKRIEKKLGTREFDDVKFRYKKDDWHSYCLKEESKGKTFFGSREREPFYQVFFENVLLNSACMNCQARKTDALSDIRTGDYWGSRYLDRSDGVSAVYACTDTGQIIIKEILSDHKIQIIGSADAKDMLQSQNMIGYKQKNLHDETMRVLSETGDIGEAIKYYRKRLTGGQKLKRIILQTSGIIPHMFRLKIKRAYAKFF